MGGERISNFRRITLLPGKIAKQGFGWFMRRALEVVGSYGSRIFQALCLIPLRIVPFVDLFARNTLIVHYDLNVYPISYDIFWFLALADLERKRRGLAHVHCIFVPIEDHENRAYPPGYDAVVDLTSRRWRFENICVPASSLFPACEGFTVCSTRAQLNSLDLLSPAYWPQPRRLGLHPPLSSIYQDLMKRLDKNDADWGLKAPEQGLRYVQKWLNERARGRLPVTVTLRQYAVDVERNSRTDNWVAFLRGLDHSRYFPILVPDTDHATEIDRRFDGLTQFTEAAWNLGLRMALYEMAHINLFVNSGPASLCVLNPRSRYLLFKVTVPGVYLVSEGTLREMGFESGTTPSFATPFQRWIWEDDSLDVIRREFQTMTELIEGPTDRRPRISAVG